MKKAQNESISPRDSSTSEVKPLPRRALILQGGGALGAYELGAIKALFEKLTTEDEKNNKGRPLFDIVAGSSIGAVNATVLVCGVLNAQRANPSQPASEWWKSAIRDLEQFWQETSQFDYFDNTLLNPLWKGWWDSAGHLAELNRIYWKNFYENYGKAGFSEVPPFDAWFYYLRPDRYGQVASAESARRYRSFFLGNLFGIPKVLSPAMSQPSDLKFLNLGSPLFWRFKNTLIETMDKYWLDGGLPIQTRQGQPRLVLVSVDVQDCETAVAFDSYPKHDGTCYSEYGGEKKRTVRYEGIEKTHLLASMATHQLYEFPHMSVEGEERYFWDGAYLSNTPLREVLHLHRDYWNVDEKSVPDLEVYIIDLYPATEKDVPQDPNSIQDREIDIKFHDKTKYDLTVASIVSDYVELVKELEALARRSSPEELNKILEKHPSSRQRDGSKRKQYRNLIKGRFAIKRSVYVERADDDDTIFGKAFDFSQATIRALIDSGYKDAEKAYEKSTLESQQH